MENQQPVISWKPIYNMCLCLLLSLIARSQPGVDPENFFRENEWIRAQEMSRSRILRQDQAVSGPFTQASSAIDLYYARLDWKINPAIRYISGNVTHYFQTTQTCSTITLDLSGTLKVDSIRYHGTAIPYQHTAAHALVMTLPETLSKGSRDSVSIWYQGDPGASGFGSFYQGLHAGVPVIWTLSEPYGSRDWWPCKNGLTDKIDSIDIQITCPQEFQPSANGLLLANQVNGLMRTVQFRHRYPIVPYLIGVAVTNYDITNDTLLVGNDILTLQNFAYPEKSYTFNGFKSFHRNAFLAYTKWFGPYPFRAEKYGHTQWDWGGGMEHQTNSFVNLPTPLLSAHELAHQWFGDWVTCGSWQHIWLNEGFATYLSILFHEYGYPYNYRPLLEGTINSVTSDPGGSVFVTDTTSESRIFNGRLSYNKGAYVVHMLRWILGDSTFSRGMKRYLNDPAVRLGFAVTSDLQRNLEQESGKDLSTFFSNWIYGQGFPNYQAEWQQNTNNWVKVKLHQTTSHPSVAFYEMPVELQLRSGANSKTVVVHHRFSGQEFLINPGFPVDSLVIDPNLWILAKQKAVVRKEKSSKENEVAVFPNPSSGKVTLTLANPTSPQYQLNVINSSGQELYTKTLQTGGWDQRVDVPLDRYPKGIYFIELKDEGAFRALRTVIKN